MTVESRHSAFVRTILNQSPTPQPFDDPLSPNQVFSLASAFITSCPSTNPPLPFKAFPSLQLGSSGVINIGTTIIILTPGYTLVPPSGGQLFAAFITVTGPIFSEITVVNGGFSAQVPQGVAGQSYMVITSSNQAVSDATVAAGPLIVEVFNSDLIQPFLII
jgi:hypothetical protein